MNKLFILLLVAIAVGIGLSVLAPSKKTHPPDVPLPVDSYPAQAPPGKPVEAPPLSANITVTSDDDIARQFIASGDRYRAKMKFEKAKEIYRKVDLLQCSVNVKQDAERKIASCAMIAELLGKIEAKTAQKTLGRVVIQMVNSPDKIRGELIDEDQEKIIIRLSNGIQLTRNKTDIVQMEKVAAQDGHGLAEKELAQMESEIRKPLKAADCHKLAVFSAQNGLTTKAIGYLERGLKLDANLLKTVYEKNARDLLLTGLWHSNVGNDVEARRYFNQVVKEYPKASSVQDAEKFLSQLLAREQKSVALFSNPTSPPAATVRVPAQQDPETPAQPVATFVPPAQTTGSILTDAENYYQEGIAHYKLAHPAMPNAVKKNQQAIDAFTQAKQLFQTAQQQKLGNAKKIEDRITLCNQLIYGCMKMRTL